MDIPHAHQYLREGKLASLRAIKTVIDSQVLLVFERVQDFSDIIVPGKSAVLKDSINALKYPELPNSYI